MKTYNCKLHKKRTSRKNSHTLKAWEWEFWEYFKESNKILNKFPNEMREPFQENTCKNSDFFITEDIFWLFWPCEMEKLKRKKFQD